MTARELFEKLHLGNNPQLARRNSTDDSYVLPSVNDAWAGFQSGMAAGMEPLEPLANEFPELNMSNFSIDDVSALNDWGIAMVTAIRAMKGEVK